MAGPSHDPSLYRDRDLVPIRRALISVSDKTDLLRLAEALQSAGVEIVSTGGSATLIRDAGIPVVDVASACASSSRPDLSLTEMRARRTGTTSRSR